MFRHTLLCPDVVDHADTSSSTVARKPGTVTHSTRSTSIRYTQDPFELHKERDYWRLFNFYGRISGNDVTSPHVTLRLFSFSEPVSEIQSKPSGSGTPKTSDDFVSKAKSLESLQKHPCNLPWKGGVGGPITPCAWHSHNQVEPVPYGVLNSFLFPKGNVPGFNASLTSPISILDTLRTPGPAHWGLQGKG
jgi:hypothetical protein